MPRTSPSGAMAGAMCTGGSNPTGGEYTETIMEGVKSPHSVEAAAQGGSLRLSG